MTSETQDYSEWAGMAQSKHQSLNKREAEEESKRDMWLQKNGQKDATWLSLKTAEREVRNQGMCSASRS